MLLRVTVEVFDGDGEELLCSRDIAIRAAPDVLFVPGLTQAMQSVLARTVREAEKEVIRREARHQQHPQNTTSNQ